MNDVPRSRRILIGQVMMALGSIAAMSLLLVSLLDPERSPMAIMLAGLTFTACLVALTRSLAYPDRVRAHQTDVMLSLAGKTLEAMTEGLTIDAAQKICDLLLPVTDTIAVAITSSTSILGYAGVDKDLNPTNGNIRTAATHRVLDDGTMRIITTAAEIGFPVDRHNINAAIIAPLRQGGEIIGTLKFYYPTPRNLTETQQSIANGFADLLSVQLDAVALEEQQRVATSMELKALQSQINPHFLFNTLNTIASLIRTDPTKARELLREFSTFYRRTLEDSSDLIPLQREVDQAHSYLMLEIARFGEDRLQFSTDIPDGLGNCLVPSFMLQPLVENSVKHAMPLEGTLHIGVEASCEGDDLVLHIMDDGTGMSADDRERVKSPDTSKGLGLAMRNISDRIKGYYGPSSYMDIESEPGEGTTVMLMLKGGCKRDIGAELDASGLGLG